MISSTFDKPQPLLAVVDDDAAVRHALAFVFETKGISVTAYGDAEAVLAAAPFPLWRGLIVDLCLPGLSGLELMSALRARGVSAPAVLITTRPSAATRAVARRDGVDIVEKPLLDDALMQWASKALGRD